MVHKTFLLGDIGAVRGYAQSLSTACVTTSTTYQWKLQRHLIYKLLVEFPEIASYIIKRIVNNYVLFLITNTEEPHEKTFLKMNNFE